MTFTDIATGRDAAADGRFLFLREFIRSPARIGAIAPSSRHLAAAMIEPIPRHGDPVVVGLGPGTGSFTHHIEDRLAGRGHQIAIEINPTLAARLTARHPHVDVITGDAAQLPGILADLGVPHVDVVVCGLPWAAFDPVTQAAILGAVNTVLAPEGRSPPSGYDMWRWTPRRDEWENFCDKRSTNGDRPDHHPQHAAGLRLPRPTTRATRCQQA